MVDMVQKILDRKAKDTRRTPCTSNRASSIGYMVPELDGCLRRGVYERTHWKDKDMPSPELKLIFDEGNNQERQILIDLALAGVDIIEQQTAFSWDEYKITGHLDGKVIDDGVAVPVEIKSMSPNIFATMKSYEDFSKKPWTRAYMAQIQIYMLLNDVDHAYFILKNKSTGQLRQVRVELDYDLAECCLKACEAVNKHVINNTLPDRITNRDSCESCNFKHICLPDIQWGEPLKISDDPEYEEKIRKYYMVSDYATESNSLWKKIREEALAESGESGELNLLVGSYHLTGKKDARGAFRLKIEDVVEGEVKK